MPKVNPVLITFNFPCSWQSELDTSNFQFLRSNYNVGGANRSHVPLYTKTDRDRLVPFICNLNVIFKLNTLLIKKKLCEWTAAV